MIYLIDEPLAEIGLRTAANDPDGTVVLIQDGVFLEPDLEGTIYAIERDVETRGVSLPDRIGTITYDELVTLLEKEEVKSFV